MNGRVLRVSPSEYVLRYDDIMASMKRFLETKMEDDKKGIARALLDYEYILFEDYINNFYIRNKVTGL